MSPTLKSPSFAPCRSLRYSVLSVSFTVAVEPSGFSNSNDPLLMAVIFPTNLVANASTRGKRKRITCSAFFVVLPCNWPHVRSTAAVEVITQHMKNAKSIFVALFTATLIVAGSLASHAQSAQQTTNQAKSDSSTIKQAEKKNAGAATTQKKKSSKKSTASTASAPPAAAPADAPSSTAPASN